MFPKLAATRVAADHDPSRLEEVCLDRRMSEAGRREGFMLAVRP